MLVRGANSGMVVVVLEWLGKVRLEDRNGKFRLVADGWAIDWRGHRMGASDRDLIPISLQPIAGETE